MNISEKLLQIAENEQKVYDAGYKEGYDTGRPEGYLDGKAESIDIIQKLIQHQVEEIDIPEGTTRLGAYCFAYCYNLRRVSIPDSVTLVDSSAFVGTNITGELVLPIACSTYYGSSLANTKFTSMKLGDARIIQRQAFENNTQCLIYDFTRNTQVPTIEGAYVFRGINPNAKILVPTHLYDDWIVATNWVEWADYIVSTDLKAVPDQSKFNIYVNANTLKEIVDYNFLGTKLGHGIGENLVKTEGNMTYLRIHGDGVTDESYAIVQNVNKQKTGKYLVYAYRLPVSNKTSQHYFQVYANTTNDTPSGRGDMFYVKTQKDGKWHVDIIDIEAAINSSSSVVVDNNTSKFTPSNGEYIAQKLRFDWFNEITPTDEYIDIAYIGLCDSLDLARAADPDYTGIEFSPEYFASKLSCEIKTTDSGMKYAVVNAATNSNGESWIWLSENNDQDYRIMPNTTMYVGVLYKDAPIRTNGNGAWGEIYACSANNSLTNSSWYSLGRIDPYDTSSGWHFGIVKFKAPLADAACRLMRFDFFNGLKANTIYTMDIAFVKCFASEDEANIYYQSYKARYNI